MLSRRVPLPAALLVAVLVVGCGGTSLQADPSFTLAAASASPSSALSGGKVQATVGQETDLYFSSTFTTPGDFQVQLSADPQLPPGWSFEIGTPARSADGSHVIHVSAQDVANAVDGQVQEAVTVLIVPDSALSTPSTLHLVLTRDAGKTGQEVQLTLGTR